MKETDQTPLSEAIAIAKQRIRVTKTSSEISHWTRIYGLLCVVEAQALHPRVLVPTAPTVKEETSNDKSNS